MICFYRKYFRNQYPAPLIWSVALAVWARFVTLAMGCWVTRLVQGKPTFALPLLEELALVTQAPRPNTVDNQLWRRAHAHRFRWLRSDTLGRFPPNAQRRPALSLLEKPKYSDDLAANLRKRSSRV